jgi:integrase
MCRPARELVKEEDHAMSGTNTKRATKRARRGRGEGGISFREDKQLWYARLSLGFDGEGKRIRKTVYGATKNEVAEALRKLQADHDAGRLVETEELTVGEYLKRWLAVAKDQTGAATFNGYRIRVEKYLIPALGGIKLTKLRPLHIQGLYAELTRTDENGEKVAASANTRKAAGVVLGIALRNAVRLRLIPSNPAADVQKPRGAFREMAFMTPGQARRFLEAAKSTSRNYVLYALAVGTGMRQGELLALTWADIDFDAGTVDVRRSLSQVKTEFIVKEPKSRSSRRTIALPQFALAALRDHRTAALAAGLITGPVFSTAGAYLQRYTVLREFRRLVRHANVAAVRRAAETNAEPDVIPATIRFHDLRHTHASGLIAAGHSIKAVSRRLGHADISMTLKVYAHLLPDDDAKLASGAGVLFG